MIFSCLPAIQLKGIVVFTIAMACLSYYKNGDISYIDTSIRNHIKGNHLGTQAYNTTLIIISITGRKAIEVNAFFFEYTKELTLAYGVDKICNDRKTTYRLLESTINCEFIDSIILFKELEANCTRNNTCVGFVVSLLKRKGNEQAYHRMLTTVKDVEFTTEPCCIYKKNKMNSIIEGCEENKVAVVSLFYGLIFLLLLNVALYSGNNKDSNENKTYLKKRYCCCSLYLFIQRKIFMIFLRLLLYAMALFAFVLISL